MARFLLLATFVVCLLIQSTSYAQWLQLGSDIDGEVAKDLFGWGLSSNSDGLTVALGAPLAFANCRINKCQL